MTLKISVGMDPEFMASYKGKHIYPLIADSKHLVSGKAKRLALSNALGKINYDEFGHCVEIRPTQATTSKQLILNIISTMMDLPGDFKYTTDNSVLMDRTDFNAILRKLDSKDLSKSQNIYGVDILDDTQPELDARANKQRLLYCGCHMHLSATDVVGVPVPDHGTHNVETRVTLPIKTLVRLFDTLLFDPLAKDHDFCVGKYRQKGFYEHKFHGGIEYRSLGASAFTPKRIALIADIMIATTKWIMNSDIQDNLLSRGVDNAGSSIDIIASLGKEVKEMVAELARTKSITGDIRKAWVPFS